MWVWFLGRYVGVLWEWLDCLGRGFIRIGGGIWNQRVVSFSLGCNLIVLLGLLVLLLDCYGLGFGFVEGLLLFCRRWILLLLCCWFGGWCCILVLSCRFLFGFLISFGTLFDLLLLFILFVVYVIDLFYHLFHIVHQLFTNIPIYFLINKN